MQVLGRFLPASLYNYQVARHYQLARVSSAQEDLVMSIDETIEVFISSKTAILVYYSLETMQIE